MEEINFSHKTTNTSLNFDSDYFHDYRSHISLRSIVTHFVSLNYPPLIITFYLKKLGLNNNINI